MYVQSKRRSKGKMETRTLLETRFALLPLTASLQLWIKAPAGSYFDIVFCTFAANSNYRAKMNFAPSSLACRMFITLSHPQDSTPKLILNIRLR
jgi:hypothetical protein